MKGTLLWVVSLWMTVGTGYTYSSEKIRLFVGDGAYLGTEIRDVTEDDVGEFKLGQEGGVYVESVEEGSPAGEAGLQAGDVIVNYAGFFVRSIKQLQRLVSETPIGRHVKIVLIRQGQSIQTTAKITLRTRASGRRIAESRIEIPQLGDFDLRWEPRHSGRRFLFFSDRPRLGITAGELTEQMADFLGVTGKKGVLVLGVAKETPAERAGLKAGDVIVSIDGHEVETPHDLSTHLKETSHKLKIVRNRQGQEVSVRIGSVPRRHSGTRRL